MSNVLNLLSESTFAEKMDMHNALLKAIVQQNGGSIDTDLGISSWAVVQQLVRLGIAPNVFNVGDQLVCEHATYGTLVWDILGFDLDTPEDATYEHSMTIGLHDQLPYAFQFDAAETNNPDSNRKSYGSNNWKESGIRQWLNADGAAGTWWTAQTEYDVRPSYANSTAGFLAGLDADMLAVLGNVKKITARNTVTDGGGYDETTDKIFLLSKTEVYGGQESVIDEGTVYPYYSENSALTAAGTGADANRIKYRSGTAMHWWLRSPNSSYSNSVRGVGTDGNISDSYAYGSYGVSPACCII